MPIATVFHAGFDGYRRALDRLANTSGRVARGPVESDLSADLVEMRIDRHAAAASLGVIRTADEMVGTILDVVR